MFKTYFWRLKDLVFSYVQVIEYFIKTKRNFFFNRITLGEATHNLPEPRILAEQSDSCQDWQVVENQDLSEAVGWVEIGSGIKQRGYSLIIYTVCLAKVGFSKLNLIWGCKLKQILCYDQGAKNFLYKWAKVTQK